MTWDISNWWLKEGTGKYPSLAKMAKDVLTVQASSVASESEFSTSGRVVTDFRSSLAPRKVRLLMLIMKSWITAFHKNAAWEKKKPKYT